MSEKKKIEITEKYNFQLIRDYDFIAKLDPALRAGKFYIDPADNKIKPHFTPVEYNSPWIHTVKCKGRTCMLWQDVLLDLFNMVATQCMNCFKIVVVPRTFKELILLHDLQIELGFEAKCGVESRTYTHRLYGGYFYTNSLDVGRIRYQTVREAVNDVISPNVPITLKRACTEMEILRGPSDKWVRTPLEDYWEKMVLEHVDIGYQDAPQPDYVKQHIMKMWMEKAWANGDKTVLEFNNGQPLMTPSATYNDNDREVLKWRNTNA